jgi:hypothetical protein
MAWHLKQGKLWIDAVMNTSAILQIAGSSFLTSGQVRPHFSYLLLYLKDGGMQCWVCSQAE